MPEAARTRVSVFIATSLDGFIARPDGDIAWLHETSGTPAEEDFGYGAFAAEIDVLVMGRGTFEKVLTFEPWPYAKPVVVLSKSLHGLPQKLAGKDVVIERVDPETCLARLKSRGLDRVYLDGGQVIQSFMRAGLVDDMTITRIPVLIGQGRPLFGSLSQDVKWHHCGTRTWENGLVQSKYRAANHNTEGWAGKTLDQKGAAPDF